MNRKILVVATIVVMASMACGAMAGPLNYTYSQHSTGGYQGATIATDNGGNVWYATIAYGTDVAVTKYTAGTMALESVTNVPVPGDPVYLVGGCLDFNSLDQMVIHGYDGVPGTQTLVTATQTGTVVSQYDMSGLGDYASVAVDNDDNVWWAGRSSSLGHMVLLTDKDDGSIIQDASNADLSGAGLSWYYYHYGAAVDENGLVYVTDYTRVMRFDPCDIANTAVIIAGNPGHGAAGTGPGEFGYGVAGIGVVNGRLVVGDPANARVQIFNAATGAYIQELTHPDMTTLSDLDVDQAGNIYALQSGALTAIHRWQIPEPFTVSLLGIGGLALLRRKR